MFIIKSVDREMGKRMEDLPNIRTMIRDVGWVWRPARTGKSYSIDLLRDRVQAKVQIGRSRRVWLATTMPSRALQRNRSLGCCDRARRSRLGKNAEKDDIMVHPAAWS